MSVGKNRANVIGVRTGPPDLEYRCHFIGPRGDIRGVCLFSSCDDASAALAALEELRMRAGPMSVELWKGQRLVARYSDPDLRTSLL